MEQPPRDDAGNNDRPESTIPEALLKRAGDVHGIEQSESVTDAAEAIFAEKLKTLNSFDELFNELAIVGTLKSKHRDRVYTADELKGRIEDAVFFLQTTHGVSIDEATLKATPLIGKITNTGGLRTKVIDLILSGKKLSAY